MLVNRKEGGRKVFNSLVFALAFLIAFKVFTNLVYYDAPLVGPASLGGEVPPHDHQADEVLDGVFGTDSNPEATPEDYYRFQSRVVVNDLVPGQPGGVDAVTLNPSTKEADILAPLDVNGQATFGGAVKTNSDLFAGTIVADTIQAIMSCYYVQVDAEDDFDEPPTAYCRKFLPKVQTTDSDYYAAFISCDGVDKVSSSNPCNYPDEWDSDQDNCRKVDFDTTNMEDICGGDTDISDDAIIACCQEAYILVGE